MSTENTIEQTGLDPDAIERLRLRLRVAELEEECATLRASIALRAPIGGAL